MKRILVLGFAREGISLARYFVERGAEVTVTDLAPDHECRARGTAAGLDGVRYVCGGHFPELVDKADEVFVSPGIPESNPVYQAALRSDASIRSMTSLFFDLCPGQIIGITGSSGKTTTTGLIGHILQEVGRDAVIGGNIGEPMLDLLPRIGPHTLVVLELSSFQLGGLRRSPQVAIVTNISPNHLDRHGSMEAYIAAKRHIVEHQQPGDYAILNADDPVLTDFAHVTPADTRWFGIETVFPHGATCRNGQVGRLRDGDFSAILAVSEIPLLGRHNIENVLAALATVEIYGVPFESMARSVRSYRPAPHRLQTIGSYHGVQYVNDSIATSPARASVGLNAFDAPVILIAGGRDKQLPWQDFARLVVQKAKAVLLIGEAAPLIERAIRVEMENTSSPGLPAIVHCSSLDDAVDTARDIATRGDVVLLSPGCTSYDMFSNFEQRGAAFARAVERMYAA